MNIFLKLQIKYHRRKLEKLIKLKESYNIVLQQSQKLDTLIIKAMKQMNREWA